MKLMVLVLNFFVLVGGAQDKVFLAKNEIELLNSALQKFYVNEGRFPLKEEGFDVLIKKGVNCTNWRGPYLDKKIKKDPWQNEYLYLTKEELKDYEVSYLPYAVICLGSDGKKGGVGYAKDICSFDK